MYLMTVELGGRYFHLTTVNFGLSSMTASTPFWCLLGYHPNLSKPRLGMRSLSQAVGILNE